MNYNFKKIGEYEIKIKFNKKLKNINRLFENCELLYSIDLSDFNTSRVTDMGFMFSKCTNLKKIKGLEQFETNKVTNMRAMFEKCLQLEELDLSNFNTSNVKDMGFMFNECKQLKRIKGIEK